MVCLFHTLAQAWIGFVFFMRGFIQCSLSTLQILLFHNFFSLGQEYSSIEFVRMLIDKSTDDIACWDESLPVQNLGDSIVHLAMPCPISPLKATKTVVLNLIAQTT